jgi:hypothetical protein
MAAFWVLHLQARLLQLLEGSFAGAARQAAPCLPGMGLRGRSWLT